jgi:uncharacterized membrane protein
MSPNHKFLLLLHIVSGFIALSAGTWVLLTKKGTSTHKKVGRVFFYSMVIGGISAISLAIVNFNPFLLAVGLFTLYLTASGFRSITRSRDPEKYPIHRMDLAISFIMLLTAVFFSVVGLKRVFEDDFFGWVYIFFALIGLLFLLSDLKRFRQKNIDANLWLLDHIRRMSGAYIATLTAFLVVNASKIPLSIPIFVYWMLPTIILFPVIRRWVKKHKKRD